MLGASTSIVEFHTTACHDIDITGKFYNDGSSLTKDVVDTVGGSTWSVEGWDGNSNANFAGGDNKAIAADDVSVVAADTTAILADTAAIPMRCVEKAADVLTGADDIFTITGGPVRARLVGIVTTVIGGASNAKLTMTTDDPAATVDLSAGAVAIDTDAKGTSYHSLGATAVFTPVTAGMVKKDPVTVDETYFILPIGTVHFHNSAAQTGEVTWYMTYEALSPSSVVAAAA